MTLRRLRGAQRQGVSSCARREPLRRREREAPWLDTTSRGLPVGGAVLADQVKSLDWQARAVELICALPLAPVSEILQKIGVLLTE